ncbi:hypothetical protein [Burkholderia glumae]|nr:hypothetical protein [Burkholderia glumae]
MQASDQAEAQAQQLTNVLNAAPAAAGAIKDLTDASVSAQTARV